MGPHARYATQNKHPTNLHGEIARIIDQDQSNDQDESGSQDQSESGARYNTRSQDESQSHDQDESQDQSQLSDDSGFNPDDYIGDELQFFDPPEIYDENESGSETSEEDSDDFTNVITSDSESLTDDIQSCPNNDVITLEPYDINSSDVFTIYYLNSMKNIARRKMKIFNLKRIH